MGPRVAGLGWSAVGLPSVSTALYGWAFGVMLLHLHLPYTCREGAAGATVLLSLVFFNTFCSRVEYEAETCHTWPSALACFCGDVVQWWVEAESFATTRSRANVEYGS